MRLPPQCASAISDGGSGTPVVITSITPDSAEVGDLTTFHVVGSGFTEASKVRLGFVAYPTTVISDTELSFVATLTLEAEFQARVHNVGEGKVSNAYGLTGTPAPAPVLPTLTSLAPNAASIAATPTVTVDVFGTEFERLSQLFFGATPVAATYVSKTSLLTPSLILSSIGVGTHQVTVVNDGNQTSNALPFTITA